MWPNSNVASCVTFFLPRKKTCTFQMTNCNCMNRRKNARTTQFISITNVMEGTNFSWHVFPKLFFQALKVSRLFLCAVVNSSKNPTSSKTFAIVQDSIVHISFEYFHKSERCHNISSTMWKWSFVYSVHTRVQFRIVRCSRPKTGNEPS